VRQSQEKLFHVSPFIAMAMRYHFRVLPPRDIAFSSEVAPVRAQKTGQNKEARAPFRFNRNVKGSGVRLRILETDHDGSLLAATFSGERRALNTGQLLGGFFALPLVTLKIMAAIHREALRLRVKGARLVPRPNAMSTADLASAKGSDYTSPALSARGKQ
jgi:DUF1365 family protein